MRGFEALPALISSSGVSSVFCMIGGTNVPWIGHGQEAGHFRVVKTRHEETSVSAATAYSRVTGTIGVCSVTRGPGFANAMNGLFAASYTHSPMALIVAESPASKAKTTQNIDQRTLAGIAGAGFHHVAAADELEAVFWQMVQAARWNGRPQVLSIGDDVWEAEVTLTGAGPAEPEPEPVDPESIAAAVDALSRAERPLILGGQGVVLTGCGPALEHLADLTGAHLATSLMANRLFSGHPRNLGLSGSWSPRAAAEAIAASDVLLAVGASLNDYTTAERQMYRSATIIHCEVDLDQPCLASTPELALFGDARDVVAALTAEWERRGLPPRTPAPGPDAERIRASVTGIDLGHDPARGLDLRDVYTHLDATLPPDRIVVSDSGRHLASLVSLVDARDARSWLQSRGYGTVGLGLGAAIGAAAAEPDRPVVLICGDGGIMMASHDLDAVRINELDVTVVIMNDEQYGSELKYLTQYGLPLDVARQSLPDVVHLARAYGGTGTVVATAEELAALKLAKGGLQLVDVRIDPEVSGHGPF